MKNPKLSGTVSIISSCGSPSSRGLLLSQRARETPASPIRRLASLAADAKKRGTKVYHLNIGQPDIPSPSLFLDAIHNYNEPIIAYENSSGREDLRYAWSHYNERMLGIHLSPEEYLITMGASEALIFLFMICCDPGDEVIVFDPTYANYQGFAAIAGVRLVALPCDSYNDYQIPDQSLIESSISTRTRAILLCNPNNPTGHVYSRSELENLSTICASHGLFFIVDETYREFVFDDEIPLSVFHIEPKANHVIAVDSLSKRFSLCGARIGCLMTRNEGVLRCALHLAQARLAAPSLEQRAAAYMLNHIDSSWIENVKQEYQHRRDVAFVTFSQVLPDIKLHRPKGAFYTLVDLPVIDAEMFCKFLLSEFAYQGETVFLAPGKGFYFSSAFSGEGKSTSTSIRGNSAVRLAYVLEAKQLQRAIHVIGAGLTAFLKLSKEKQKDGPFV